MNKGFIFVLGAIIGAASGSLLTWKLIEEKYKRLADEEIESVINTFKNRETEIKKEIKDKEDYKDIISDLGYDSAVANEVDKKVDDITYIKSTSSIDLVAPDEYPEPYVISPEEYGELEGYKTISLMFYIDDVLADDNDVIVDDAVNIIGDALVHFGDYEDDAVHVRNEREKTDYEILKSEKSYDEVINFGGYN